MLIILYYCLKVIICSGLLFGYYLLALRNNRFHHWNRYYLLAAVLLSFTLPLLKIPLPFFSDEQPVIQSFRILAAPDLYFSNIQPQKFVFNWPLITGILYGIAVLFFVYLFIRNVFKVLRLKKRYIEENLNGIHFYNTNEPATPFSFFNNIFWNSSISLGNEKGQQMLQHEMTHIQEKHSVDKVAMELLIAFAWWNPFLYYIRKELSVIHEFIADQKASAGDAKLQYASLLLMKAMGSTQYALGNPFFHTQLKRRLVMLTTINNPKFSYVRRLLVLPLAVLAIVLFSFKYDEGKKVANKSQESTFDSPERAGPLNTDDDFYEDTARKKHAVIKLKKDYKGSPILHVIPTFDLKGVVVKTVDGKTYFLNREESAKELGMTFSDKSWTAPQGAYVTYFDENDVPADRYMLYEKYEGGQKQMPVPPVEIRLRDSTGNSQPLYMIDGKEASDEEMKKIEPNSIQSINVLKDKSAIDLYGEKGRNGVVIITLKGAFPNNALYVIDGKEGSITDFKKLSASGKNNINWKVEIIEGWQAAATYGEKGRNGVVVITTNVIPTKNTTPAWFNEKTLLILDGKEVTSKEVYGIGDKGILAMYTEMAPAAAMKKYGDKGKNGAAIFTTKSANKEVTLPEAGQVGNTIEYSDVTVVGYPTKRTDSTVAEQKIIKPDVTVVGYQNKYNAVFSKVEEPASFPGGIDGWRMYLQRNLMYPEAAQKNNTQGVVRVQLTVHEDGSLTDIKALNDPGNGLAEEALRVIKKGPKWIPAKQNGKVVTYQFVQTLTFQLQ